MRHSGIRERGFTLIEILIVLAIVAIFISTAVVNIDQVATKRLGNQGYKLKAWFEALSEESALTNEYIGVKLVRSKRLLVPLVFAESRWRQLRNIKPYQWSDTVEIKLLIGSVEAQSNGEQAIEALKMQNEKITEDLSLNPDEKKRDVALIFPDFFVSPLQSVIPQAQLLMKQDEKIYEIEWDAIGEVLTKSFRLTADELRRW